VSHASILTGRYPYEHGIRDNTGYRLPAEQPTAATLLKARGFATGAFVGGFPLDRRFGLTPGFDVYDDRMTRAGATGEVDERERPADAVVKAALDWIGAQPGKWFAWVHVYDPHEPYQPPGEFATRFASDPYLGEVSWTDAALGPLFDRLSGLGRPTLVIVTGDHGESLGEHGERTHSLFAYEATLRVPLIVTELGKDAKGTKETKESGVVIGTAARHVDLLPTLLASAAAPAVDGLPGASLLDTVAAGSGPDRPSYFEAMSAAVTRGWAPLRGVLVGREKYIDLPITELYDVAADPKETNNVVRAKADRARVMVETLKQFNVAPPARAGMETADTIERLRSLGYIGGGSATVRERYTDADDPKQLVEIDQMLTRANEALRAGRAEEAAGIYQAVMAKRPDTEDAYRKLALIYWRSQRPAPGDRDARSRAARRRHAERGADQARAVPGRGRPAGEGDRVAVGDRRQRSRCRHGTRQRLHARGPQCGRDPHVHPPAADRTRQRPGMGEPGDNATAGKGCEERRDFSTARHPNRSVAVGGLHRAGCGAGADGPPRRGDRRVEARAGIGSVG
jgi:arylsulfatase A-like enzyme